MPDLTLTRTLIAEHSYPTPTRNHLSMHNRELSKARVPAKTRASELRYGYRAKDGTTYMFPTASERAEYRRMELENERLRKAEHARRIQEIVTPTIAETDSWAHKS